MSDKLLIKNYDREFWDLVAKGNTLRKARRELRKKYPNVSYNSEKGEWHVDGNVYKAEADND